MSRSKNKWFRNITVDDKTFEAFQEYKLKINLYEGEKHSNSEVIKILINKRV